MKKLLLLLLILLAASCDSKHYVDYDYKWNVELHYLDGYKDTVSHQLNGIYSPVITTCKGSYSFEYSSGNNPSYDKQDNRVYSWDVFRPIPGVIRYRILNITKTYNEVEKGT